MPTPAYVELDSNTPDGTTGTGTTYSAADLATTQKLRDMAISGRAKGFVQSRTTGTGPDASHPQFITWLNSSLTLGFRMNSTWGGTGNHQQTSVVWEWSNDNGVTWTAMGSAQANTFDANDNITASTNTGGIATWVMEIWTKCLRVVAGLAAHNAATGTSVHGLGTMSTQAASGVAITGGTINGTTIGASARAAVSATRVVEDLEILSPGLNAGATVNWGISGLSAITVNGTNALTFTGVPVGASSHLVYATAFNGITWPAAVNWGAGGRPSIAGVAITSLVTFDGGSNVFATVFWQA